MCAAAPENYFSNDFSVAALYERRIICSYSGDGHRPPGQFVAKLALT
jgi:hypothetical protein